MCFPRLTLNLPAPSLFLPRIYLGDRQDLPPLEVSVTCDPSLFGAAGRNGWFSYQEITADGLWIDPELAGDTSPGPAAAE